MHMYVCFRLMTSNSDLRGWLVIVGVHFAWTVKSNQKDFVLTKHYNPSDLLSLISLCLSIRYQIQRIVVPYLSRSLCLNLNISPRLDVRCICGCLFSVKNAAFLLTKVATNIALYVAIFGNAGLKNTTVI